MTKQMFLQMLEEALEYHTQSYNNPKSLKDCYVHIGAASAIETVLDYAKEMKEEEYDN
jgi:hypothetical protein